MSDPINVVELFQRDPEPSLAHAALLVARDAYPSLDCARYLAEIERTGLSLQQRLTHAKSLHAQAGVLASVMYDQLGFRGNEENYYDPRNSYLNDVLERRTGIPITLAIVLIAMGRSVGLEFEGVGFPGHFLVRLGGRDGIFLDPFSRAKVMSPDALERLVRRVMGDATKLSPDHLAPASTRSIIVRMLINLKAIYHARRDHPRLLVVCDRLVDLTESVEHRRDRGLSALALGAQQAGEEDLDVYLHARPDASDATVVRATLERTRGARVRHLH